MEYKGSIGSVERDRNENEESSERLISINHRLMLWSIKESEGDRGSTVRGEYCKGGVLYVHVWQESVAAVEVKKEKKNQERSEAHNEYTRRGKIMA